jgi:hypothetical protein
MKSLSFLSLASLFSLAALADNVSVPAASQTQPAFAPGNAVPPPVHADPAAIEATLKAMHYDEIIGKLMDQKKQIIVSRMQQELSNMKTSIISKEEFAAFEQKATDDARGGITPEQIHGDLMRVYGEVYTTAELQAMANFYNTPVGQAISLKQPDMEKKVTNALSTRLLELIPTTQRIVAKFALLQQAKHQQTSAARTTGASSVPTTAQ